VYSVFFSFFFLGSSFIIIFNLPPMDFKASRNLAKQASEEAKVAAAHAGMISRGTISPNGNRLIGGNWIISPSRSPSELLSLAAANFSALSRSSGTYAAENNVWMLPHHPSYDHRHHEQRLQQQYISMSPPPPPSVSSPPSVPPPVPQLILRSPLRLSEIIKAKPSTQKYRYSTARVRMDQMVTRAVDQAPHQLGQDARRRIPASTPTLVVYNPHMTLVPRKSTSGKSYWSDAGSSYTSPQHLAKVGAQTRMRAARRAHKLREMWS
jgi:hypothetical protein